MLSNMATSLIENKRITTTVAKAKALRKFVEPLITKAKSNTTHSRRLVFSHLQNKYAVQMLFDEVAGKIGERPGGYTRIIKMGNRLGDNADMALIELVDYNELLLKDAQPEKAKTRRSRRGGKSKSDEAQPIVAETVAVEEAVVVDEVEPVVEDSAEVVEDAAVEATETSEPEAVVSQEAEISESPEAESTESPEATEEPKKDSEEESPSDKKE